MLIAQQKRKENIVEYIVYMWHIEDLLRLCRFNMDEIDSRIISAYQQPEEVIEEIRQWYKGLVNMALNEGIEEKGHLQFLKNIVLELTALHDNLLHAPHETVYGSLYYRALPAIVQLRSKASQAPGTKKAFDEHPNDSEIETCLTAVYGYFLLKLQARKISVETTESLKHISQLLAFLAARTHESEK